MFWTGHFRYLPWKVIETVRGSTWTLKQSFVDFLDTLPNIWLKMETIVFHIFSDINFLDPPAYQGSTGGKSESFQDQQQKWGESFFCSAHPLVMTLWYMWPNFPQNASGISPKHILSGRKLLVGWKLYSKSLQQHILLLLRLHRLPRALRTPQFCGSSDQIFLSAFS